MSLWPNDGIRPGDLLQALSPKQKDRRGRRSSKKSLLLTNAEFVDDAAITLEVGLLEIVEKAAAASDEFEKPATAVMILRVRFEMLVEISNSVRQKRDLHFRRTGIAVVRAILGNEARFFLFRGRQNPVSFTG